MSTPPPASSPRRRGLGRGLNALFAGSLGDDGTGNGTLIEIDPAAVVPNPEQPRRLFDDAGIDALAESIRLHGLLHPIVVERSGDTHQLVAGERRLRAARRAGVTSIPALVRPAAESARHALELALTENLLRSDLSPIEEATAYARLADTFGLSHEAIALRVGRSRSMVSNTIRLLTLPATLQSAVADGRISSGHARALLGVPSASRQEQIAARIESDALTVRDVERLVQGGDPARSPRRASPRPTPDDDALRRGLETALGVAVGLERRRRGGRVILAFSSDEELHALYTRVGGPPL